MALAFDEEEERELVPVGRLPRRPARAAGTTGQRPTRRRMPVEEPRLTPLRFLFGTNFGRVLLGLGTVAMVVAAVLAWRSVRSFLEHDPHFALDSADAIEVTGSSELPQSDLMQVFGSDLGHNLFSIPLKVRQQQLEQMPWVAHATVMRLLPNRLRVAVVERVPVAFVRLGKTIELVDRDGVILHLEPSALASRHYSFPVVTGLAPTDAAPARAQRMHLYGTLMAELGAAGAGSQISVVDLADSEDVRVSVPAAGRDLTLDLGDSGFLPRFQAFEAHLPEWRQQFPELSEIDLRYDRQVVLKMADGAVEQASSLPKGSSLVAAPEPEAPRPAEHVPGRPGKQKPRPRHTPAAHWRAM